MPAVLHVLPHPGGGGEKYIDLLAPMPGYDHERTWLSASRTPLGAGPSIAARWRALSRQARRYDLLHLHGDMASMLALALLRREPGVVSTHGLSFLRRSRGWPRRLARARWARVALTAGRIVCASEAERDELLALAREMGVAAAVGERLIVVPNGIPLPTEPNADARRAVRTELGLDDGEVAGLYLGLLDRYKDPLTAVRAAQLARDRGAPLTLLVAGDGPLLDEVRSHAGPAVRVLGFRDDPERLLGAADVFVMPSLREGGSYALLEAMGHGLAVVASDGAGIPEMVGPAAIVAPTGDVEAFANALVEVALEPSRREELGAGARARVAEGFSAERFVAEMRRVYDAVLTEAPTSP